MSSELPEPEFSRIVELDRLGPDETVMKLVASGEECNALAARFGLQAIDRLRAEIRMEWLNGRRRLRVRGRFAARVVQTCVVSLDPVENEVDEEIDILFDRAGDTAAGREVVLETTEDAEPLEGDTLDLGELVAEELALSLDPYPRKPGLEEGEGSFGAAQGPESPFRVLERLKRDG